VAADRRAADREPVGELAGGDLPVRQQRHELAPDGVGERG
jgi:hypothetical protein